jgi:hypothetical protein
MLIYLAVAVGAVLVDAALYDRFTSSLDELLKTTSYGTYLSGLFPRVTATIVGAALFYHGTESASINHLCVWPGLALFVGSQVLGLYLPYR